MKEDIREDATSTAHGNSLRHRRSFVVDTETISLPLQALGLAACLREDRVFGLPVASVTFHQVCFSDHLTDQLADILIRHRSFRILTFVKCRNVDACLYRIRRNLVDRKCKAGSKLSHLHVRLSPLDDVNVVAELADVLSHSLHALSLTGCSIMSTGCAAGLVTRSRHLSELDLGFNDVADVAPLSDALAANCFLRSLRLRGNAIGSAGAASLFGSLQRNYRLELLDISGNPIGERRESDGDDLWHTVAEALLSNRSLRDLKLERCSLGVEACSALGRVLAANTTLRVLDVSMNQSIGDLGVALLADGLRRNRRCRLCTLSLNMCAVGNVGFRSLLVAVKDGGATWLQHIKLCYNRIGSRDKLRPLRRQRSIGATDGRRDSSQRTHPASAVYGLRLEEESHLPPLSDRPGSSTPVSGWLTGSTRGAIAVPSSMPMRRKNRPTTCHRPLSSIVMSNDLLIETDNEDKQPILSQHPVASNGDARLVSNGATTAGTVFKRANRRPALESTPMTSEQRRTVVDGDCNWAAVKELATLDELLDTVDSVSSRLELDCDASSALGTTDSSVDCGGMTATLIDAGHLLTAKSDEDSDVDDDEASIYVLLCHVLRANPQLKVLLWGNQQ